MDGHVDSLLGVQVERSLLPWDFYVLSQLRRRLSPEDSAALPSARCFLFQDACVTLYTVPNYQKLSVSSSLLPQPSKHTGILVFILIHNTLISELCNWHHLGFALLLKTCST